LAILIFKIDPDDFVPPHRSLPGTLAFLFSGILLMGLSFVVAAWRWQRVLAVYTGKQLVDLKPTDYAAVLTADERKDYNYNLVMKFIWDCAQLGKKIIMNGTYGIIAAYTSNMRMQSIAAVITREARQFLEFVRHWIESNVTIANGWGADAHVVYGDSVADFTPVVIHRGGYTRVLPVSQIVPERVPLTDSPTDAELAILRTRVDPRGWLRQ